MAGKSDITGKQPLLGMLEIEWTHYAACNALDGHGAVNVDLQYDDNNPTYMTIDEAKEDAISKGYAGFTFAPDTKQVWRLKEISDPSSFKYAYWAEVYVCSQRRVAANTSVANTSVFHRWCGCRKRPSCHEDVDNSEEKKARVCTWAHYAGRNAYDGFGAYNVDLERDNKKPMHMTVEKAKADVISKGYAGFTYEPGSGRMWRLKTIWDPSSFKPSRWVDAYVLEDRGSSVG